MKAPLIVLGTMAAAIVFGAVGTYAFANSTHPGVAAATPNSSLAYWTEHLTMEPSMAGPLGANIRPEGLDRAQNIAAGGPIYQENCASCHGRPVVGTRSIP